MDGSSFDRNFLAVNLNSYKNRLNAANFFVMHSDETDWKNVPSELAGKHVLGYREVQRMTGSNALVKISEHYPVPGRIWTNYYNTGTWTGWKNTDPNVTGYRKESDGRESWKFPDGTLICSRVLSLTVSFKAWVGGLFYGNVTLGTYPIKFVSNPAVTVSVNSGKVIIPASKLNAGLDGPGDVNLIKGNGESETISLHYIAIGRWK